MIQTSAKFRQNQRVLHTTSGQRVQVLSVSCVQDTTGMRWWYEVMECAVPLLTARKFTCWENALSPLPTSPR